jgi:plastocyanin
MLLLGTCLGLAACQRDGAPAERGSERAAPQPSTGTLSVRGRVRWAGDPRAVPTRAASEAVKRFCPERAPWPTLQLGEDGGLAAAVVSLEGAEPQPAEAPGRAPVIDQKACAFTPAVVAARAGTQVTFLNSDPLLHNVRADLGARTLFNVAMPVTGLRVTRALPATAGVVTLRCDVHPWMAATVRTFEHSAFTQTDANGYFTLAGLPPGPQRLNVWHPDFPERTVEVTLPTQAPVEELFEAGALQAKP